LNFGEAARYSTEDAEIHAVRRAPTPSAARAAIEWSRDTATLDIGARALGWCGDAQALELTKEIATRFPTEHAAHVSAPIATAAYMVRTGNRRSDHRADRVKPYEDATMAKLWPSFLRGHIYMARKDPARAAMEFQHVIDRRSESSDSALFTRWRCWAARAAVATSERAAAEQYRIRQFVRAMAGRRPDLEPLVEARREAARLH
jgi:hypothetical protein